MTGVSTELEACAFHHDAFIYDSDEGYLGALVPLIEEAHAAGDTVVAVVPRHNQQLLRSRLGEDVGATQFVDAETWYQHPITTIAGYDEILRGIPSGSRAFVVGEVQFGDTEADWTAWTRYEAALNATLDHYDARVICPYDARSLPACVVENARRTHPYVLTATEAEQSAHYLHFDELVRLLPSTVEVPSAAPDVDVPVADSPAAARHAFATAVAGMRFSSERADELTLAINELLTNALLHGGGSGRLRVWIDGDMLTCVVDDSGSGLDDALVGYSGPPTGSAGGYGAWIARRLFQHCEFVSSDRGLSVLLAASA